MWTSAPSETTFSRADLNAFSTLAGICRSSCSIVKLSRTLCWGKIHQIWSSWTVWRRASKSWPLFRDPHLRWSSGHSCSNIGGNIVRRSWLKMGIHQISSRCLARLRSCELRRDSLRTSWWLRGSGQTQRGDSFYRGKCKLRVSFRLQLTTHLRALAKTLRKHLWL